MLQQQQQQQQQQPVLLTSLLLLFFYSSLQHIEVSAQEKCPPGAAVEINYSFICSSEDDLADGVSPSPSFEFGKLLPPSTTENSHARCQVRTNITCRKLENGDDLREESKNILKREKHPQSRFIKNCSVEYKWDCHNDRNRKRARCRIIPVRTCLEHHGSTTHNGASTSAQRQIQTDGDCQTIYTKQCNRKNVCRIIPRKICESEMSLDGINEREDETQQRLKPFLSYDVRPEQPKSEVREGYLLNDEELPPTTGRSLIEGVVEKIKKIVGFEEEERQECREICRCTKHEETPSCRHVTYEKCDVTTQRGILSICNNVINKICKPKFRLEFVEPPSNCIQRKVQICDVKHTLIRTPGKYESCTTVPKIRCQSITVGGIIFDNCTQYVERICRKFDIMEVGAEANKICVDTPVTSCFNENDADLIQCNEVKDVVCGEQVTTELVPNECSFDTVTTCSPPQDEEQCMKECEQVCS